MWGKSLILPVLTMVEFKIQVVLNDIHIHMCLTYSAYNYRAVNSLWDIRTGNCVNKLHLESPATSLELSQDGKLLVVSNGKLVSFVQPTK